MIDVSNCNSVEEIVEEIIFYMFNVYNEHYVDGEVLYGTYITLENKKPSEIAEMDQLKRLAYNLRKKSKEVYGKTNESDSENNFGEALLYLVEALYSVFYGTNTKLNDRLICNSVDDVKRLLSNPKRVKELCKYSITYIDLKFKTLIKSKANPDFIYNHTTRKYKQIDYLYLDKDTDNGESNYDLLTYENNTNEVGEVAEYILENYKHLLTNKQMLYMECYLIFGTSQGGSIRDFDNRELYCKQESYNYRKKIKAKIMEELKKDDFVDLSGDRIKLRVRDK